MIPKLPLILIIDDDQRFSDSLVAVLRDYYTIIVASNFEEAIQSLRKAPNLILLDIRLQNDAPDNMDGLKILKLLTNDFPSIPVIMMTAYGSIDVAVEAMKHGAADFVQKSKLNIGDLRKTIGNTLEKNRLKRKVSLLEKDIERLNPSQLIGNDPKIIDLKKRIRAIAADSQITVLIKGATGTGKELVARAIHAEGVRNHEPFVPVAISALSKNIIESELFGHEKSAFTGADKTKNGYIEKADGGVLFLDEIGDLDKDIQVKLLRFLEDKTFCRMGSTDEIRVDIQLVTATNSDLQALIAAGDFREDLYYRLRMVELELPRLSERKEDIPLLAEHFLNLLRAQGRTKIMQISEEAQLMLYNYDWPGNVRELRSCIERAIIFARQDEIRSEDLPREILAYVAHSTDPNSVILPVDHVDIGRELSRLELTYIEKALKSADGKKSEACKLLNYNDRFAMLRRIQSIQKKYPDLMSLYPSVQQSYCSQHKVE